MEVNLILLNQEQENYKYEITVEDYVTGIILTPPTKLVYECGEELDLTGGKIEKVMASGTKIDVALSDSSVSISGYDKTKAGSQTINVIYEGITKQFGVTVEDNVQSVTLIGTPKTEYMENHQMQQDYNLK